MTSQKQYSISLLLNQVSPLLCRGLADTKQTGNLTREQFSLAMFLIQQKTTKGIDPPLTLTPDMIPPSERNAASAVGPVSPATTALSFRNFVCVLVSLPQDPHASLLSVYTFLMVHSALILLSPVLPNLCLCFLLF